MSFVAAAIKGMNGRDITTREVWDNIIVDTQTGFAKCAAFSPHSPIKSSI